MSTAQKIIKPYDGFQDSFVRSNLDFVVGGGGMSGGKTSAAVLSVAEAVTDPYFRAVFLRNNLGDLKSGGGILDEFKKMYGRYCTVVESGDPHVDFPSGARIDVTHIADQSVATVLQRFKGRQYDYIYFDEGTGFTWDCFRTVYSRNRGIGKWTGKVRMTTNPSRSHWLRTFLDWYIGADGFIIPERNGIVRYFYVNGKTVRDVIWGNTKDEVYMQCKLAIDRQLKRLNGKKGKATYKDMIKSFTFYEGKVSENKAILSNNPGYVGSIAIMGGETSQANLEGNWNVDADVEGDSILNTDEIMFVFDNDPQENGDKWITADLADVGTDNFIALVWNGFHIIDIKILTHTRPAQNAEALKLLAEKHDIPDAHIIYDGIRGLYINDYIPDAIPFISNYAPQGLYKRAMFNLKTECFMRLVNAIKGKYLSISEDVAKRAYIHEDIKSTILVMDEFREECEVIAFRDMPSGKKALLSKKEMNQKLGKGRSMDVVDPIAMRFYPVLDIAYGNELSATATLDNDYESEDDKNNSVFDPTLYGG